MLDKLQIQFWKVAIWLIKRGYGADCEFKDTDEFEELKHNTYARCGSCKAREIIEWIEKHITLIGRD